MKNVGSSLNDLWSRRSSDYLWMKFDLEDFSIILKRPSISKIFRRSLKVLWYQRSSEGHWMVSDLDYLNILERYSIHEERREFFEWPLISKIFGWSSNEIWPRSFEKILDWYSISKIFRRSLKDLRHGRSSDGPWLIFKSSKSVWSRTSCEGPWMIFDLDFLKLLECSLISKILRKSLEDLRLQKLPQIFNCSLISKTFRRSLNDLWPRISSKSLDWYLISIIFEWNLISKIFRRFLNDLRSRSSSEGFWLIFDLEDLPKILEWSSISIL